MARWAGRSAGCARSFPPPAYELPSDAFFEITGAAQVIPAVFAARWLGALLAERFAPRGTGKVVHPGDVFAERTLVTITRRRGSCARSGPACPPAARW